MHLKYKKPRNYEEEVINAIKIALGRIDIGFATGSNKEGDRVFIVTDLDSNPLTLTDTEKTLIKNLSKVKEKLE